MVMAFRTADHEKLRKKQTRLCIIEETSTLTPDTVSSGFRRLPLSTAAFTDRQTDRQTDMLAEALLSED